MATTLSCAACAAAPTAPCPSDLSCPPPASCDRGACVNPQAAPRTDLRPARIVLGSKADATVLSSGCCVTSAFGAHDVLVAGSAEAHGHYRTYMYFDLSHLESVQVARAQLTLTVVPRWSSGSSPMELLVFPARRSWPEAGTTWADQPGGRGYPFGSVVFRPDHAGLITIDLTELVAAWTVGQLPNHGIVLQAGSEGGHGRIAWYSREAREESHRPLLEVNVR